MEQLKKLIFKTDEFVRLQEQTRTLRPGQSLSITGIAGSFMSFIAAGLFQQHQVLIISPDDDRAEKLHNDCELLAKAGTAHFYSARQKHHSQIPDAGAPANQIETLKALNAGTNVIVIATPESIGEKVPAPDSFTKKIIELQSSAECDFQKLIDTLTEHGFERKDFVETYGDFAVRGGILDIFPYVGENPLRIEFWGNTIESIREFDVLSQRSIRTLQSASIVPSFHQQALPSGEQSEVLTASLFDYLKTDAIIIIDEPEIIKHEIDQHLKEDADSNLSYEEIYQQSSRYPVIIHSLFSGGQTPDAIDFRIISQPSFNGSIHRLTDQLRKLSAEGYKIFLSSDTKEEAERLRDLVNDGVLSQEEDDDSSVEREPVQSLKIEYVSQTPHSGFIAPGAKIVLFTEHEIFGRLKRRSSTKRRRFKGLSQKDLHQLRIGDFVVHRNHGIGTFAGLKKIKVGGTEQEVVKLLFLDDDALYVNLNFIERVQKYSSQEGIAPKLHKLGSAEWEKTKAKAKRRIKDIARELITLYARRKHEKGFAFSPDTHWQKELEASFIYDDTPDQAAATLDVKRDMENSSPMDRLICGDVGFGKTEVAVRAAFKAVMNGKQVAILVPTTVLALQHYRTFQDRLARYTVRAENITRFKSTKEQKSIVAELQKGSVDIIIGTHRLLSKDIGFKNLGLLIIDEEHRFGVTAKEKLRQLKIAVDTLTLTATPIPRTLHFSLMGARDLSIIATPPRNRLPIETEIIASDSSGKRVNWNIVREAIVRELHRGGQIYVVHDRVQTIDAFTNEIRSHIPEARVHCAHGQMPGHELEKTMMDFLEKKYDVLVCTKIIESGLDIPNVNTIIINRADTFGLAELYQLRGRVGRSNVQAYAYLLTPPLSVLPKTTIRRLQAIEEFTELGSGFNLSMRDMEIRGTGNLLGAEQSGFILEMGFEMYERIVSEAVAELKEEEFKNILDLTAPSAIDHSMTESVVDVDIDALIPDFYIESDPERLDVYRRLYNTSSAEEILNIREELIDRFGEYPEEVEHLFLIVELRLDAMKKKISKISLQENLLVITLPPSTDEKFYGAVNQPDTPFKNITHNIAKEQRGTIQIKQNGNDLTLHIILPKTEDVIKRFEAAREKLNTILST